MCLMYIVVINSPHEIMWCVVCIWCSNNWMIYVELVLNIFYIRAKKAPNVVDVHNYQFNMVASTVKKLHNCDDYNVY